jgi:hypothetical protein
LRRRGEIPNYIAPISLILAAEPKAYVGGITDYRAGNVSAWLAQSPTRPHGQRRKPSGSQTQSSNSSRAGSIISASREGMLRFGSSSVRCRNSRKSTLPPGSESHSISCGGQQGPAAARARRNPEQAQ